MARMLKVAQKLNLDNESLSTGDPRPDLNQFWGIPLGKEVELAKEFCQADDARSVQKQLIYPLAKRPKPC